MTVEQIKEIMDIYCLGTLNDTIDLKALKTYLKVEIFDKNMEVVSVEPMRLPNEYKRGQAFRLTTRYLPFTNEYNGKGELVPQSNKSLHFDMVVHGVLKTEKEPYRYFFDSDSLLKRFQYMGKADFIEYLIINFEDETKIKELTKEFEKYTIEALFNKYHEQIDNYERMYGKY